MAAAEFVKKAIAENAVVVFSKTYCPYCTKAKNVLSKLGARFFAVELDQRSDGGAIQSALADLTGRTTVPNVFISGQTIGGGDDTAALDAQGKLRGMLEKAGAL